MFPRSLQDPMYKKVMAPLAIFLIDSSEKALKIDKITNDKKYHRCFILKNSNLKKDIDFKQNDSVFIFDFISNGKNLLKLITSYTDTLYTHYIIYKNLPSDVDDDLQKLNNENYMSNSNYLFFAKKYYVMNNIELNLNTEINIENLDIFEIMDKVYNNENLSNQEFIIALNEIIPMASFVYDEDIILSDDILNLLNSKNIDSKISYKITNKITNDKNHIIFTLDLLEKYKFKINRTDGLKFYIN